MPTNFQTLMQRLLMLKNLGQPPPPAPPPTPAQTQSPPKDIELPLEGTPDPRLAQIPGAQAYIQELLAKKAAAQAAGR